MGGRRANKENGRKGVKGRQREGNGEEEGREGRISWDCRFSGQYVPEAEEDLFVNDIL